MLQTKLNKMRALMLILCGIIASLCMSIPADAYQITITANGTYSLSSFINTTQTNRIDTVFVVKETTDLDSVFAVAPITSVDDSITFYTLPYGHQQAGGTTPVKKIFLNKVGFYSGSMRTAGSNIYYNISFNVVFISDPYIKNSAGTAYLDASKPQLSDWVTNSIPVPFRLELDSYFAQNAGRGTGINLIYKKNVSGTAYVEIARNSQTYSITTTGDYKIIVMTDSVFGTSYEIYFTAIPPTYTITYNTNGGDGTMTPTSYTSAS
ncbi:MAG: hypothetical protein ACOX09_09000 [Candidatus Kapaibacterium sp.]|jgi:hypothetical protein